ncbi:MAG TPA: hypothetical protein VIB49_02275 [Thermoplasmata archaeon]|jgi:hypothetical protein
MSDRGSAEGNVGGGPSAAGRNPLVLFWAILIVASFVVVGLLLYEAQFSAVVRWLLGFGLLAAVALVAWMYVYAGSEEPLPLAPRAEKGPVQSGDLALLTAVVHRANEGLPYSQVLVSSRARDAFAERARLALGLSPEAMRRAGKDPAALRALVRDPVLEDLLYLPTLNPEERYRWVREAKVRGGFPRAIHDVIDRIEVWR